MTPYETIRYELADGILTVTLDRPDRLNAFTVPMGVELIDAFDRADDDDAVRAIIVTGAGRGFCAGADLGRGGGTFDFAARGGPSPVGQDGKVDWSDPAVRDNGGRVTLRMFRSLKPIIAAINGPAVGIGITMTLPADIRLIATGAKVGFTFARLGIVPEAASCYFLPRIVGISRALEWTLTGRMIDADEALASGLVRSVHPGDTLLVTAHMLAREIVDSASPVSVALTRQMLWRGLGMTDPMEGHRIDSRAMYARGRSADAKEGIASFIDKRPPHFADRVSADLPDFFPWWDVPEYR